ncbi:MAG: type II toxin-antitoxin system RelE/ParE family toxin [Ahrensia sp.]|nr:type II toxin-antitoxin system RelE/ParE family toxin [Ahrensia sp.]
MKTRRKVSWIKAARKSFNKFPDAVQTQAASALTIASQGQKADIAKPLTGFVDPVFEIVLKHRGDAYRVIYAVKIGDDLWVVHAFQKKSNRGIKTPQKEIDTIKERINRLKEALR